MIERNGDLFTTDAKILGHGVNVEGVMGAGIAKTFKEKFPKNYKVYKYECDNDVLEPGHWTGFIENGFAIFNLASQDIRGKNARYDWLFASLFECLQFLSESPKFVETYGSVIAIPEIGCGIGGLEWKKVARLLPALEALFDNKFEFEVWHYA